MDIHRLGQTIQKIYAAGLMLSTHKTYQVAERRYLEFCNSYSLMPLPTAEGSLCYFVRSLPRIERVSSYVYQDLRTYVYGVQQLQISHGFKDPGIDQMPSLQ